MHDALLETKAQREGRGDFEHLAERPGWLSRLAFAAPAAVIEAKLLLAPVTNVNLHDVNSVVYLVGLIVVFFWINDQVPKWAGRSIRAAREARAAASELTAVGTTISQDGDR